jgi:histidyl-tRNA synthetase
LTVPFARFAAQHAAKLGMPFKRYHIGTVWRGENTQAGRFREFVQCDFDIIGTTANAADIEICLVIHDLLAALGFDRFEIRINNRLILNGVLEEFGLAERAGPILIVLDKLAKQGRDAVQAELTGPVGLTAEQAERLLTLVECKGTNAEILAQLKTRFASNAKVVDGIARLEGLLRAAAVAGIPEQRLRIDLGICRGLDYYTGTIYETFLTDLPRIGSVCSGGRYDDLAGLYTKQKMPGVGASLGLDRLLAAMEELKLTLQSRTPAQVLVVQFDAAHIGEYQKLARELRAAGVGVEVFPDAKKIGPQLQYAESRGFSLALIAGPDEMTKGVVKLKNLAKREESEVKVSSLVDTVKKLLAEG